MQYYTLKNTIKKWEKSQPNIWENSISKYAKFLMNR